MFTLERCRISWAALMKTALNVVTPLAFTLKLDGIMKNVTSFENAHLKEFDLMFRGS